MFEPGHLLLQKKFLYVALPVILSAGFIIAVVPLGNASNYDKASQNARLTQRRSGAVTALFLAYANGTVQVTNDGLKVWVSKDRNAPADMDASFKFSARGQGEVCFLPESGKGPLQCDTLSELSESEINQTAEIACVIANAQKQQAFINKFCP